MLINHIAENVYLHVLGETACGYLYISVRNGLKYVFQGIFMFSKWLKEGNCNHKTAQDFKSEKGSGWIIFYCIDFDLKTFYIT